MPSLLVGGTFDSVKERMQAGGSKQEEGRREKDEGRRKKEEGEGHGTLPSRLVVLTN